MTKKNHSENRRAFFWVLVFVVAFAFCYFLPDTKKKNEVIQTEFIIDPITQLSHVKYGDDKKDMTTVSFGSPEEDMLVCIDARGHRNFKKIVVIEEK